MIVWTDSCQRNRTLATIQRSYFAGGAGWSATGGRNNGPKNIGRCTQYPRAPVPSGPTFIGFVRHVRFGSADGQSFLACTLAGAEQIGLGIGPSGVLKITRAGTQLAVTSAGLIDDGVTLHGFAIKAVIHPTAGTIDVYMNGVIVPALSFVGNTRGQANDTWDSFIVGQFIGGVSSSWCDLMVADGTNPTGSDVNDLVPDVCIDYAKATGNGYSSQFVGDDGNSVDNYLLVDDLSAPDTSTDTTDFVQSPTPAIDSYAILDHPVPGATIIGRTVVAVARKTTTGVASVRVGSRIAGANTMGAAVSMGPNYQEIRANLKPVSEAEFNASEAVVEML